MQLNHKATTTYGALGFETEEELNNYIKNSKGVTDDIHLALMLMNVINRNESISVILEAVTGLEFETPSEVAEYIMTHTKDEDRLGLMSRLAMTEIMGIMRS